MKNFGRAFAKAAESLVEALSILGGWNRGKRKPARR